MNKRKLISRYAVFLLGIVIMSEPVLSYGYTIKQPIEFELSAYGNILEVAGQNATAEADPRELVSWKVYFVDEESRQIQLSVMRSGTILEGEELVIPYANSLIVNGHRWLANEDSPYRVNVYGPGEKIIYITYSDEGSVGDVDNPEASERERFEMYLERAKKADAAIVGKEAEEILDDQIICESNAKCSYRLRSLSAQIKNTVATPVYVIAKDCAATGIILKELYSTSVEYSATVENGQLVVVHENGSTSLVTPTDDMLLRPAVVLSAPDAGTADPIYWSVGDVQKVVIDQKTYEFRCVDTNYYDKSENHQKLALFLCDEVIPANYGSEYSYLPDKEGIMGQVFLPGPVVNFGDESDYKYSKIHNWLSKHQNRIFQSFNCHIGVDSAFTGSTGKGRFSELSDQDLTVHSIGYQRLTARLFSLSVEEALKYKDYLWKFGDTDADNPEVVTDNFCNGYWLRSPMGNADANSGYAYIVDLVNGMIRPEAVKPDGGSTDEELRVTTSIGVRPAFAVPQG